MVAVTDPLAEERQPGIRASLQGTTERICQCDEDAGKGGAIIESVAPPRA